jgi:hypothetical protein
MTTKKTRKPATKSKRKSRSLALGTCSAIPFVNKEGHVMRLARSMTLRELLKMGVVEIHLAKPGTPLREGEWRDAEPDASSPNSAYEPTRQKTTDSK